MLTKPEHGWCNVEIGDFTGWASYIMDVPFNCLNSFISYFTKGKDINSVAIAFDEEGSEFTVVSNYYSTYVIIERDETPVLKYFSDIDIKQLANELINDLEMYFNEWVNFECYDEPNKDREDKLRSGIDTLRILVDEF
jgi:hypothetical protein